MAWRIVKQPNGLLARWSDIVDNFTYINMTEEEAYSVCRRDCGISESREKVMSGIQDLNRARKPGSGRDRWDDCIDTIRIIHGKKEARSVARETKLHDDGSPSIEQMLYAWEYANRLAFYGYLKSVPDLGIEDETAREISRIDDRMKANDE